METESFQPFHQPVVQPNWLQIIEVIWAEVTILDRMFDDAVSNTEQSMCCRDGGSLHTPTRSQPAEESGEIVVPFRGNRPGRLAEMAS